MKFITVLTIMMMVLLPSLALAKGSSSSGRSSVSRSYSAPTKSVSTSKPSSYRASKSSTWFSSKDDDIECSDLRRSKHPADKIVYKRYC